MVSKIRSAGPLEFCESSAGAYKNTMSACYKPEVNAVSDIYNTLENLFMSCNGKNNRAYSVELEVFFFPLWFS